MARKSTSETIFKFGDTSCFSQLPCTLNMNGILFEHVRDVFYRVLSRSPCFITSPGIWYLQF